MLLTGKKPMAIDAVVTAVEWNLDGTATMRLGPRLRPDGLYSLPGQESLAVLNPPKHFDAIVGTQVKGDSKSISVNGRTIAARIGWGAIKLTRKER